MSDGTAAATAAELVVVTAAGASATPEAAGAGTGVADVLAASGLSLIPIFAQAQAETEAVAAAEAVTGSDLDRWFVTTGEISALEPLAEQLRERDDVEAAYVKPPAQPAVVVDAAPAEMAIEADEEAPATGNFVLRQGYLLPAPVGVDAAYGWSRNGGRGDGVRVIDCEWGWQFNHEDLAGASLGLVGGTNSTDLRNINHGTAVMGVIGGDHNGFGINGIAPNSPLGASSVVGQGTAGSIVRAANVLGAGDILLIEMHRSGPNDTTGGNSQQGFIAMEWWPDDLAAIRYAVGRGVVVVEAAGNGWENLDAAIYNQRPTGFPSSWRNPFNSSNPSSGAVMVGAGSPPNQTHGKTTDPWGQPLVDRARCPFSNWGSRVDAQGWGWEVTTTGYGDLAGATPQDRYTDRFSGTSSASPVVLGALASTQGVLKAAGMPLMGSERARQLLRSTGSPQQPAPNRPTSQRIGNRPNLRQLIPAALTQTVVTRVEHTYALHSSQAAWAWLQGFGWRRVVTGSADGVSNVLAACIAAQMSGKRVQVQIDDTQLHYAIIL